MPCPAIQIIGPSTIANPGETMTFLVKDENAKRNENLKYTWTASLGSIIEGQNTPTIKVATTAEMSGANITAKVEIRGLPTDCTNEFSEVSSIEAIRDIEPIDDYGKISRNQEAGRLDNLFFQLTENPKTVAFIRILKGENATANQIRKRIKRIVNHANFRRFPKQRLIFLTENSKWESTVIFIFPENYKVPECENCEIIKGEDVK